MRIEIQAFGFPLTSALLEHVERRLSFALTRTSDRIERVVVRLGNRHGPGGGKNKFCRIQVILEHAPPVLIEDASADLYAVIDRAAERVGRNVARRVDRLREKVRLAMPQQPSSPSDEASDVFRKTEGVWL